MTQTYLEGFGLAGFRSFGDDIQRIGPLGRITVLVGANNSGKSNILSFLANNYREVAKGIRETSHKQTFGELDRHLGSSTELRVAFGLRPDGQLVERFLSEYAGTPSHQQASMIQRIRLDDTSAEDSPMLWFDYTASWSPKPTTWEVVEQTVDDIVDASNLHHDEWFEMWRVVAFPPGVFGTGGNIRTWVLEVMKALAPTKYVPSEVFFVPSVRHIVEKGSPVDGAPVEHRQYLSGERLITHLAQLEQASYNQQFLKERFAAINGFVRDVTTDNEARLSIPYDRKTIEVHMNGRTLPLQNVGTGIEEVITLAAAATVADKQMLCIEEPELHLHPVLQRKLFEYLRAKTSCQIFVTTHSAHILDMPEITVSHVTMRDGATLVEQVRDEKDRSYVCFDLGYRPSDLVQANCVIWVEGPSDRIYINHWIHQLVPSFVEGIQYSVMCYGGSLLAHMTADDPAVEEFIGLRRLNHRMVVVMDSDRARPRMRLSGTKRRIQREFETGPGFAWVTAGREIENYIPAATLEAAVRQVHPSATNVRYRDKYDDRWKYRKRSRSRKHQVNRYRVALEVVKELTGFQVLDLKSRVRRLVAFIQEANGIS